ncbi:MAG: helix-turn-helix domain-containing protein [Oscillospiraceae bacterium]
MSIFSNRIKELRIIKKVSQANLADIVGVSQRAVSYYEAGKDSPSLEILVALANFFEVSTDYLLGITDIPRPIPANLQKIINKATDPAELLQALEETSQKDNEQPENKIDALIQGLDEESMRELRKYITFLHSRQTLDDGEDESSAGLDGK